MRLRQKLRLEELRNHGFEDALMEQDGPLDLGSEEERRAYELGRQRGETAAAKLSPGRPRVVEPIGGFPR